MASEAQRLISISLSKIAQSRSHRGGVSLHKNLLVATVLQKARYIFMEEAYNMVHYQAPVIQARPVPQEDLVVEENESTSSDGSEQQCIKCAADKENQPPQELTYIDLDKGSKGSLKRRRAVAEWETEEAVQSILPKRTKSDDDSDSDGDNVFVDDATLLSETAQQQLENSAQSETPAASSMEIERITSLVSIFSFSMGGDAGKLNRSVSAPDLCSAQAKDVGEGLQQRPFLAMTV